MKLAAAIVVATALVLPAAQASDLKRAQPVLGFDVAKSGFHRLAWFNPMTLKRLPGHEARLGQSTGSWAFSPDRLRLAIAVSQPAVQRHALSAPTLRFVNLHTMRVLGEVDIGEGAPFHTITWFRPDRLLAVVRGEVFGDLPSIAVVDPSRPVLVRRVTLPRPLSGAARFADGLALLLGSSGSFAPAVVAVVDASGEVRTVTLDRISIGTITGDDLKIETRGAGFAVDPETRRAFVVGADFTVAEVNLDTLGVNYHGGSARSLAKFVTGPSRSAVWLGNGLLAVSGVDNTGGNESEGQPVGVRLIDTRDWTTRLVDPTVSYVWAMFGGRSFSGSVSGNDGFRHIVVYGLDGVLRYRFDQTDLKRFLNVEGPYAYLCYNGRVLRILDAATGATLRMPSAPRPACPNGFLYGESY
jgi:hypothetical protein